MLHKTDGGEQKEAVIRLAFLEVENFAHLHARLISALVNGHTAAVAVHVYQLHQLTIKGSIVFIADIDHERVVCDLITQNEIELDAKYPVGLGFIGNRRAQAVAFSKALRHICRRQIETDITIQYKAVTSFHVVGRAENVLRLYRAGQAQNQQGNYQIPHADYVA